MKNQIISVLAFVAGAGVGVLATQQYFKKKYEQIAQEDINDVKASYFRELEETVKVNPEEHKNFGDVIEDRESLEDAVKRLNYKGVEPSKMSYSEYEGTHKPEPQSRTVSASKTIIIPPEDYGDLVGYDEIELIKWADGIVSDGDDILDNVEDVIGDALDHIGEYEDDTVYVRNTDLKVDYCILVDERTYAEAHQGGPRKVNLED